MTVYCSHTKNKQKSTFQLGAITTFILKGFVRKLFKVQFKLGIVERYSQATVSMYFL